MTVRFIPRAHGFLNLCSLDSLFSLEHKYALVWECSVPALTSLQPAVWPDFLFLSKDFTKNWKEVGIESPTPSKVNQTTAAESFDRVERILCTFSRSFLSFFIRTLGCCGGSDVKESACNVGDSGSTSGSGGSQEGNGNPLQYSCLEDPVDRGARWATVHGVAKSWTWLSD